MHSLRFDNNFKIHAADTLYFYRKTYDLSNYEANAVHGLTKEFLEQYKDSFYANIAKMYAMMYKSVIIGKNSNKFDIPFIERFYKKKYVSDIEPLDYYDKYDVQNVFGKAYKNETGSNGAGTLTDYLDHLKIPHSEISRQCSELVGDSKVRNAHDALFDVVATFEVFKEIKKRGL